jgi:hypothetical protein
METLLRLPNSFTLFPALPSELRLKIWGFAIFPRTIGLERRYKQEKRRNSSDRPGTEKTVSVFIGWMSADPPPITLSICHDSREEALKVYQLAFGSYQPYLRSYAHMPRTYVNFSTDTLYFGHGHGDDHQTSLAAGPSDPLLDLFLSGGFHGCDDEDKIQRMIIDNTEELYGKKNFCWDEIREFRVLKELTILAWEDNNNMTALIKHARDTLSSVVEAHPEWVVPKITIPFEKEDGTCFEVDVRPNQVATSAA